MISLVQTGNKCHFADEHPVRGEFKPQSYKASDCATKRQDYIAGWLRLVLGDDRVEGRVGATVETDRQQGAAEHGHVATAHVVHSQTRRREVACRVEAERHLNHSTTCTYRATVVAPANPVVALQP